MPRRKKGYEHALDTAKTRAEARRKADELEAEALARWSREVRLVVARNPYDPATFGVYYEPPVDQANGQDA